MLVLFALPALAQVEVGDNILLNLGGDVNVGYEGSSSNVGGSSHGLNVGGDTTLSGSYFSPNFLTFSFSPYYNRSQANSSFQSISDSSGFSANASLFGGSHFPGSISFSKAYDSTGEFGIPATAGYVTHGDTRQIALNWNALVPDWPSLYASYILTSNSSSIYGTDSDTSSSTRNLSLRSQYVLKGFHLSGGFVYTDEDSSFPDLLTGSEQMISSNGSSNAYQLSASHSMPLQGSFSASYSRVDYQYNYMNGTGSGSSDTIGGTLSMRPLSKLTVSLNSSYSDSLAGSLAQTIIATGGAAEPVNNLLDIKSLLVNGTAFYVIRPNFTVQAQVSHTEQYLLGQDYGATSFGGSINYNFSRPLLGVLTFSLGVVDNATEQGNNGAGIVAGVYFSRRFGRWETDASFNYAQNVQTLLAVYTTSAETYSGTVARKINGHFRWSAGFSGGHSGFTANAGTGNSSERVNTSISYRQYLLTGYWGTSSGTALLTGSGLVPVPTGLPPGVLPPSSELLFNARSYGMSASATAFRRMVLTGSYSRAYGNSVAPTITTANDTTIMNALVRYPFRKLYFTAGFLRFNQAVGTPGSLPSVVNSYYFGISRWFKLF